MSYFCYVYPPDGGTPYMEALPEMNLAEAQDLARRLLAQRPASRRAELWDDDRRVAVLARDEAA